MRGGHSNNPYLSSWARYYEFILKMPPLYQIRTSEEATLDGLLDRALRPTDRVLEIGPGTGRQTVKLASRVAQSLSARGELPGEVRERGVETVVPITAG